MPRELAARCALVVPCYNEAIRLNVSAYVEFLQSAPEQLRLVFVDDGSRDKTLQILERVRAEAGPERVIILPKQPNAGKADAVRYGMSYAVDTLQAEITGFWDADLATPLDAVYDLLSVLAKLPEIEMVFGARVKLLGRHVERNVSRHYLGRVFATVVSNVLNLPVYDTQCGAKVFRATREFREVLQEPFVSRWIFDVEIIARFIQRKGVRAMHEAIYEYPLKQWEDVAGSKVGPGDFFKAAGEIVVIRNKYLRRVKP